MTKQDCILDFISFNEHGAYFIYRVPSVKRGIRGKSRGHVDEVMIVGIPKNKVAEYIIKNNIDLNKVKHNLIKKEQL